MYSLQECDAWVRGANSLAYMHSSFWEIENVSPEVAKKIGVNSTIINKIHRAQNNAACRTLWKRYMDEIYNRLAVAPKTLIHGDTFPTNILVDGERVGFVDWANASVFAYMLDIGRLTSIIDMKTLHPMCPCPDEVIDTYYKQMQSKLHLDYSDYLKDIHMAQFLELAAIYTPRGGNRIGHEYDRILEDKLNEIVLRN